ncbi:hypothetical protein J6E39_09505 [bacterium]|nr:hypothetical protein [bacterium]
MSENKIDRSVWMIFFEGVKIYCQNFHKFFLYMAFPVLGQLLGLLMIFGFIFWFSSNLAVLSAKYQLLNNFSTLSILIILIVLPGLIIFTKAFWEYLIAYGALNSMAEGALTTSRVYDFPAHKATVKQNLLTFIGLWFLYSLFLVLASIPFFFLLWIGFVYFVLIFQVFTFEKELSPVGCFKRSFELIKGKFGRTVLLMAILGVVTFYLITAAISVIFDAIKLSNILVPVFETWCMSLPIEEINKIYEPLTNTTLTPLMFAKSIITQIELFIAVGFTLPLRSICWTLWYKNNGGATVPLKAKKSPRKKTKAKEIKKAPTSFKIEKREIDPEIIRRARWEDDNY